MGAKGINERVVILMIVVCMLMNATWCSNGEEISSTKSIKGSALDNDHCIKHCVINKCMPKLHDKIFCTKMCHYYCTQPREYFISAYLEHNTPASPPCAKSSWSLIIPRLYDHIYIYAYYVALLFDVESMLRPEVAGHLTYNEMIWWFLALYCFQNCPTFVSQFHFFFFFGKC